MIFGLAAGGPFFVDPALDLSPYGKMHSGIKGGGRGGSIVPEHTGNVVSTGIAPVDSKNDGGDPFLISVDPAGRHFADESVQKDLIHAGQGPEPSFWIHLQGEDLHGGMRFITFCVIVGAELPSDFHKSSLIAYAQRDPGLRDQYRDRKFGPRIPQDTDRVGIVADRSAPSAERKLLCQCAGQSDLIGYGPVFPPERSSVSDRYVFHNGTSPCRMMGFLQAARIRNDGLIYALIIYIRRMR